jgi:Alpha amylase, catalytic domain
MPFAGSISSTFRIKPHPLLYEINAWSWLERISADLGRMIQLDDVPDSTWDSIAERGFDVVWLMGVWRRSPDSRRIALEDPANFPQFDRALPGWKPGDVIASPYAVAAYLPDARIGTWDSIDRVRNKLHARGMGLFLDFVGNHTALDHPWVREHAEYYVQAQQHEFESNPAFYYPVQTPQGPRFIALAKDPYYPPWKDVAQLNHFHPAGRAAQLTEIKTIASHCDGVRCDMAMLLLNDIFAAGWRHLIADMPPPKEEFWSEVKSLAPNLALLAEAYWGTEQRLFDLGFEFAYDKSLYDAVRDVNPQQVRDRLNSLPQYQNNFARFMENHDEARRPQIFPNARLIADGTLMGTLPGMRFYHQGELEGRTIHLPITLRLASEEPIDPFSVAFFQKILDITKQDVFHKGEWKFLEVAAEGDDSSGGLIVYEWRSQNEWKVMAVNLSGNPSQGRVRWHENVFPAAHYTFYDELNEVTYARDAEELSNIGLFVRRDPFQAHLFDVAAENNPTTEA